MPYAFKPDTDDVILSTWEERDRLHVNLSLREGEDGSGPTVVEWWDGDAVQAFEDGFLKRDRRPGKLTDGDTALLQSAFEYAVKHEMPVLKDFVAKAVERIEAVAEALPAHYDTVDGVEPVDEDEDAEDRRERLIDTIIERSCHQMALSSLGVPTLSEERLEDVQDYLRDSLREALEARPSAAPAP